MTQAAYLALVLALLTTHLERLDVAGSRAFYPGRPSTHGVNVDGLEGFSRMAPMYGAWIVSGRDEDGSGVSSLRRGLLAGTNPASGGYWGEIRDYDQRIVEAADIALAIWLTRHEIWEQLEESERNQIAIWLRQVNGQRVPDNNWHLFVALNNVVLKSLGVDYDAVAIRDHYTRFKSFYRGGGWFADGPQGQVDYYNAWGMQWALLWLDQIDPELDRDFIRRVHKEFASSFIHFFTPNGFPIMGRSTCYRLALPAPLVLGRGFGLNNLTDGQVRRALNVTWQYFLRHGALDRGRVTQGYWRDDRRLLEPYSGPASCFWSLRSLTAALLAPPAFWQTEEKPLPVELENFTLSLAAIGWKLEGALGRGEVRLQQMRPQNQNRSDRRKYNLHQYSSHLPYFYQPW